MPTITTPDRTYVATDETWEDICVEAYAHVCRLSEEAEQVVSLEPFEPLTPAQRYRLYSEPGGVWVEVVKVPEAPRYTVVWRERSNGTDFVHTWKIPIKPEELAGVIQNVHDYGTLLAIVPLTEGDRFRT